MGGGQQPQVQYSVLGLGYPICKMGLILVLLWETQAQVLDSGRWLASTLMDNFAIPSW